MRSSPSGPGDHESRFDLSLAQACGHAADFLDRPAYQRCSLASSFLFWGDVRRLARWRTTAIIANASITRETCRCQPCHERVSLWVSPNSVLAVSNASSIAQRWPSTRTSVSIGVPAGHQVEKNARSPSERLRRISRPRVHRPVRSLLYSSALRSANSTYAQSYKRAPFVPSPADRRVQASGTRAFAICSAVPATSGLSIQELN